MLTVHAHHTIRAHVLPITTEVNVKVTTALEFKTITLQFAVLTVLVQAQILVHVQATTKDPHVLLQHVTEC